MRDQTPGPETFDVPDVVAALRELSVDQRRVIVLHHLADLTVAQVATELGMPDGTVKAHLARGRARLAALLKPDLEVPCP